MEAYFCIELPDYAAPSFSIFHRICFGTANDLQHLPAEPDAYTRAVVLFTEKWSAECFTWKHINIWGCAYAMSCAKAESTQLWLECEGAFYRCVRAVFTKLRCDGRPVTRFWGCPGTLETEVGRCYNRLAVVEKCFASYAETQLDHSAFCLNPDPNFQEFYNDILGDG